jgi:hypothetical protein
MIAPFKIPLRVSQTGGNEYELSSSTRELMTANEATLAELRYIAGCVNMHDELVKGLTRMCNTYHAAVGAGKAHDHPAFRDARESLIKANQAQW